VSRKLFAFLLSELKLVRVKCPKCAAVAEVTIEQAGRHFEDTRCPVCKEAWYGLAAPQGDNYLTRLAKAIQSLQAVGNAPEVEFVLPDEGEKPSGK
jgi:predicted Zn finger-like uncharacterized protein